MTSPINEQKRCIFCNREKKWHTILIATIPGFDPIFIVTVCPMCRSKRKISEIYQYAHDKIINSARADLEKG